MKWGRGVSYSSVGLESVHRGWKSLKRWLLYGQECRRGLRKGTKKGDSGLGWQDQGGGATLRRVGCLKREEKGVSRGDQGRVQGCVRR